jgi:polyphenol oxidase
VSGWLHRVVSAPPGVGAAYSGRGSDRDSFDLGTAVGPAALVAARRASFEQAIGARPQWLRQVHGAQVVRLHAGGVADGTADASWTTDAGVACTVLVADCLPVLFAGHDGQAVAAAHAGWRGLAAGVLERTVEALHQGAGVQAEALWAWLGPCIGPRAFEVGPDVLEAFPGFESHFVARPRPDGSPRWLADLAGIAAARLRAVGVHEIHLDGGCTVERRSDFFSFRRDGVTGRMAAAVWRR